MSDMAPSTSATPSLAGTPPPSGKVQANSGQPPAPKNTLSLADMMASGALPGFIQGITGMVQGLGQNVGNMANNPQQGLSNFLNTMNPGNAGFIMPTLSNEERR
jgi:hypothetical protein